MRDETGFRVNDEANLFDEVVRRKGVRSGEVLPKYLLALYNLGATYLLLYECFGEAEGSLQ